MPTGTVGYYLPRGDFDVVVTQTAACAKTTPIMKTDVSVVPRYERDPATLHPVDLEPFGKGKTKLTFSFYDDGRLKGINSSQTGQAGEIVTAVANALPVIQNFVGVEALGLSRQSLLQGFAVNRERALTEQQIESLLGGQQPSPDCVALQAIAADKPVTVIREARSVLQNVQERPGDNETFPFVIPQTTLPPDVFQSVSSIFGNAAATLTVLPMQDCGSQDINRRPYCVASRSAGGSTLRLRQPARVRVVLTVLGAANGNHVFEKDVMIPQYGPTFSLPIGKPRPFGESAFELTLSESGSVQSLGYSKGSGASSSIGAVGTLADGLAGGTVAEQAAAFKAEADLIAQQQRLIRCQLAPADCT